MPIQVIKQDGSRGTAATMDDVTGGGAEVTVDHITDAGETGKDVLKAATPDDVIAALVNEKGELVILKGLNFKGGEAIDEHPIEFYFNLNNDKPDASIMANANADGGAIALAVRGKDDPAPINAVTVTAAGQKLILVGHPDFALHVGKALVDISNITAFMKDVVECADAAALRTLIGAGTSNLELGTTATTAMAGDTVIPPAYTLPAATAAAIGGVKQIPHIADLTAAPTQADINTFYAALRTAGIMAAS